MDRIRLWLRLSRAQDTPAILLPVLVDSLHAAHDAFPFRWLPFLLTLAGACLAHLGANAVHETFDFLSGAAGEAAGRGMDPPRVGSGVLLRRELTAGEAWQAAGVGFALALAFGVMLVPLSGSAVVALAIAGLALAILYAAPPVALSHVGHGIGELAVLAAFGPLPVLGGYYTQARQFSSGSLMASLPLGLYTTAILYNHHFTRFRADAAVGKNSPVVELGETRALAGSWLLPVLAYVAIWANVELADYPAPCLVALVTAIPMGYRLARLKAQNPLDTYVDLTKTTATLASATGLLIAAGFLASFLLPR